MSHFAIATRASPLAVRQAEQVADALRERGHSCEIRKTRTSGDELSESGTVPGGKEAFVDRVRHLVLSGDCDLAVHSLKDLPTAAAEGLSLIAVPQRLPVEDVLIVGSGGRLADLPAGARIGTASLRRRALLLARRPDLEVASVRGNVQTRLARMASGECDALILALAGLQRLELSHLVGESLPADEWLCSPGQGALAIECRTDAQFAGQLSVLQHKLTRLCTDAERAFSRTLGADCHAPVAAWCRQSGERLCLAGFVGAASGKEALFNEVEARSDEQPAALGERLAEQMLADGASRLLPAS